MGVCAVYHRLSVDCCYGSVADKGLRPRISKVHMTPARARLDILETGPKPKRSPRSFWRLKSIGADGGCSVNVVVVARHSFEISILRQSSAANGPIKRHSVARALNLESNERFMEIWWQSE